MFLTTQSYSLSQNISLTSQKSLSVTVVFPITEIRFKRDHKTSE
jgi:hypothetical protein